MNKDEMKEKLTWTRVKASGLGPMNFWNNKIAAIWYDKESGCFVLGGPWYTKHPTLRAAKAAGRRRIKKIGNLKEPWMYYSPAAWE